MKTKFFLTAVLACTIFFVACSSGPSAETKNAVAKFDTAWSQMSMQAMAFGDSVKMALTNCENCCKSMSEMPCCEHMKGKMDSMMMPCKNDATAFQDMMKAMQDAKPMMDSAAADFTAFKEKVNKGEVKDDEAKKTLADFQMKMDNGSKMMADWMTKYNDAKAACVKNMADCNSACKDMKCTDKKCMEMEKKKGA
jgi:hypothetical protein